MNLGYAVLGKEKKINLIDYGVLNVDGNGSENIVKNVILPDPHNHSERQYN